MLPERLRKFAEPMDVEGVGRIALIDVMGDDAAVLEAARKSYGKSPEQYTDAQNRYRLREMVRLKHTSPFETGCIIKLWVELPLAIEAQWARHRMARWNQISRRFVGASHPPRFYIPDPARRADGFMQKRTNRQGSERGLTNREIEFFVDQMKHEAASQAQLYMGASQNGIANELARFVLGQNLLTEKVWQTDLRNLLHLIDLRIADEAQWEFRVFAQKIAEILEAWVPETWEAFVDYQLEAETFSRQGVAAIRAVLEALTPGDDPAVLVEALSSAARDAGIESKREIADLVAALTG